VETKKSNDKGFQFRLPTAVVNSTVSSLLVVALLGVWTGIRTYVGRIIEQSEACARKQAEHEKRIFDIETTLNIKKP